jgi:hypothetical protein
MDFAPTNVSDVGTELFALHKHNLEHISTLLANPAGKMPFGGLPTYSNASSPALRLEAKRCALQLIRLHLQQC